MNFKLILLLLVVLSIETFAQKNKFTDSSGNEMTKEVFLKDFSNSACNCIDTIEVTGQSKERVTAAIHSCIEVQVGVYMLGAKLIDSKLIGKELKKGKKEINLDITLDPNSQDFKNHYYELERYLMDSCKSLKLKVQTNETTNNHSFSSNVESKDWYSKALEASEQGDEKKAISFYKNALKIDSNFAFAWDNLGLSYRKLENFDSAIFAYKKSLQIDPRGVTPLQNLAVAYLFKQNYEKAISTYQQIAKIEPNNPEIYYGIGNVYANYLKNYEEGLQNLCKAYNLYIAQNSPYRSDAEKLINLIYREMKDAKKEKKFKSILKENNINMEKD